MNVGSNNGRRLRTALSRFAAMLIEEARDITGYSYAKLDEELGLPDGQAYRYSLYPITEKTRAPQASAVQELENRVARLLKRAAHTVVVENNKKYSHDDVLGIDHIEGKPADKLNFRAFDSLDFQLGYEGDWPTYRRLKRDPSALFNDDIPIHVLVEHGEHDMWPEMLRLYSWQWGVLWNKKLPWLVRQTYGIALDIPIESFLNQYTQSVINKRYAFT